VKFKIGMVILCLSILSACGNDSNDSNGSVSNDLPKNVIADGISIDNADVPNVATENNVEDGNTMTPRVTGQESAAEAQVILNEVNTDQYPRVRIFTTVLKDGAPLRGLGASDFRVREDEVDQEPITVESELPPLSVVITLDTSGSMAKRMQETQAAAKSFLDTLGSNDSAQAVSFARETKQLTTMSTNHQAAREAIGSTVARGDTALYDALYESVQLVKDRSGRKAIVLLSDGVDDDGTGKPLSKRTVEEVIDLARMVNVPIYVLGLGTEIDEAMLTAVARETGALFFSAPQAQDLTALYAKIGEQLAGQYAISYTSNLPADGTEHRVVLTSQSVTDVKTYKAPDKAVAQEPEHQTEQLLVGTGKTGIGTFEFKWPQEGSCCWDVVDQKGKLMERGSGPGKTVKLPLGVYTVKPTYKSEAFFEPFKITIENGVMTTVAMGGVIEFKSPGGMWEIYRSDDNMRASLKTGPAKQALQAGVYIVKPYGHSSFEPFEVTVKDGVTTSVDLIKESLE